LNRKFDCLYEFSENKYRPACLTDQFVDLKTHQWGDAKSFFR
jgi:hypothetical protein